jgi:DNA polymerase III alpha subunit
MFLKTYYPVEFFWALLHNESDKMRISRYIKDAREHDVPIRACDVSYSGSEWKLAEGKLVGALSNIQNVGPAAVKSIEAKQPFTSFSDFLRRVNRRRCNKRVVEFLLKGGAFDALGFSVKAALENLSEIWSAKPEPYDIRYMTKRIKYLEGGRKGDAPESFDDRAVRLTSGEDFDPDDYEVLKSKVNPIFLGKHPVEPHMPFIQSLRKNWLTLGVPELWDKEWGYVFGQVVEIKYNRVGDFHSGDEPSAWEKKKKHWGAQYANINIEDITGGQQRMKIDISMFEMYRHIVDAGVGSIVVGVVSLNKRWKSARFGFVHDLLELKGKIEAKKPLTTFERAYFSSGKVFKKRPGAYLITHVMVTWDKNKNEMCRIGLVNGKKFQECVMFHSLYKRIKQSLKPGRWAHCRVAKGIVEKCDVVTK